MVNMEKEKAGLGLYACERNHCGLDLNVHSKRDQVLDLISMFRKGKNLRVYDQHVKRLRVCHKYIRTKETVA